MFRAPHGYGEYVGAIEVLKATWQAFNDDKALRLSAAISYATMFSIVPLMVVLIAIAGWVLGVANGGGHSTAENALLAYVRHGAGDGAAAALRDLIASSFNKPRQSIVAQVVGWLAFIVGASGLFGALQDALNTIWHVEAVKGGWRYMLRSRLASFGMVGVVAFLLLVSFVLTSVASIVAAHFARVVPLPAGAALLNAVSWLISLVIASVVFGLVYTILPDVRLRWRDVWIGSVATAVLFVVGQTLIAWYLSVAGVASAYGAAGAILIAFVWVYYSAAILLLGAEFTKVRASTATTTAPAEIRNVTLQPAGVDPRKEPDPAKRA
jgi:membrane protein